MSSIFVRARHRSHRLLHTAERPLDGAPPSLVVVGVGTAGVRRSLLFCQRMTELSAADRIQTAVFYDCNEVTVAHVQKRMRKLFGATRDGVGIQLLFPNYIPLANGFMRDPKKFLEYEGPLERDMDTIVNQVLLHSERCGRAPEMVIEFMSFSGHAILGARFYQKMQTVFPAAVMLPVMMLPKDHASEEWTRRYLWEQYEDLLGGANCLVTTQSAGSSADADVRLATGLAGFEVAEFGEDDGATNSQLCVTFRRLVPASGGWLGMATVKRRMPVTRKFKWLRFPPWWREYAALGPDDELSMSLGNAIWSTLDPAAQLAEGVYAPGEVPQEMVVSLPVHADELEPVASNAAEVLERSNIFERFPNMDIAFTTARFNEGLTQEPYLHAARIYPIRGELTPVTDILRADVPPEERARPAAVETGFGSYYHLPGAGTALRPSPVNDGDKDENGNGEEDDWRQHVRYF